ncbi:hypothetical protein [Isachenkonia alkalipeptolytica]|uniref:Uncharacterized protein n=1 Tax=Isachenkonia alkalipeptolytica TaxID=2565777 RepID=A0AA43XLF4_9CLOT|nr:hypothetical protein [Isachenkonia alkalipeptolytica]NBG88561.1 hypothetical protein [Isachenkonia alkalipeptolytica]
MSFVDLIYGKYRILSVVGMGKNAGKTVVLNRIIEEAYDRYISLGLTSIGRDGEREDLVTNTDKPVIHVMEGTIVATAQDILLNSDARLEILEVTDYRTTLGPVVICRVKENGLVELAGPGNNEEIREVAKKMLVYGADIVVVDGAINRKTAASPGITEAAILATGAVVNRSMDRVIEETAYQIELFGLKALEKEGIRAFGKEVIREGCIGIADEEGNQEKLPLKTSLNGGRIIGSALSKNSRYIIFPGSLVKKTIEDLIAVTPYYKQVVFVVQDGTKIFIPREDWVRFKKRGVRIQVMEPLKVVAVSINPYAPQGYEFPPLEFLRKMKSSLGLPVIDVMLEGEDVHDALYG